MPELPEVETVRNTLKNIIIGKKIIDIKINYDKLILGDLSDFKKTLLNEEFKDIKRYGKYLIFIFNNCSLLSHLRMEGKFFIKNIGDDVSVHEHVLFSLNDGSELRYHDTRKFGILKIIHSTNMDEIMKEPMLEKLGIEANSDNLNKEYLYEKLKKSNNPIKVDLLDQSIICGLGNIYVDEVLFKCNIHPLTISSELSIDDCFNIVKYSKEVIDFAIECGGTTIRSYLSSLGVTGRFQINLCVHTLEGQPCKKCGTIIKKIFVGGRGTYYCPKCQEKKHIVVGLTGGIATGKTAISDYLVDKFNAVLIDADLISKEIASNKSVIKEIEDNFGSNVILENGLINRKELAKIIFNNNELRTLLNNIIHPKVIRKIKSLVKQYSKSEYKYIIVSAPLLFEVKLDEICDEILVSYVDEAIQIERLMKRDLIDETYASRKIRSQMSNEERRKYCSIIGKNKDIYFIDNSTSLCYTYEQLNKIFK